MSKKEIMTAASAEILEQLRQSFPTDPGATRVQLPRLSMYSQDKFEGKGKTAVLVKEAGMFYTERQGDELDEEGKKVWVKEELGNTIEALILFRRKQLRYYDGDNEKFTSSPVYDEDTDIVPLFCDRKEVNKGTPAELKKAYEFTDPKDGKIKSKLEDNVILYVLYKGEMYQMGLRGSSMYSYKSYVRKTVPSTVITKLSSEAMEKGSITWNQMSFTPVRPLNSDEATDAVSCVKEIMAAIAMERAAFASRDTVKKEEDKELDSYIKDATKLLD